MMRLLLWMATLTFSFNTVWANEPAAWNAVRGGHPWEGSWTADLAQRFGVQRSDIIELWKMEIGGIWIWTRDNHVGIHQEQHIFQIEGEHEVYLASENSHFGDQLVVIGKTEDRAAVGDYRGPLFQIQPEPGVEIAVSLHLGLANVMGQRTLSRTLSISRMGTTWSFIDRDSCDSDSNDYRNSCYSLDPTFKPAQPLKPFEEISASTSVLPRAC